MIVHVVVGGARRSFGSVYHYFFRTRELVFGDAQALLDALARDHGLFAHLTGGCAQQFLCIGDHDAQVRGEFVPGDVGVIAHNSLPFDWNIPPGW